MTKAGRKLTLASGIILALIALGVVLEKLETHRHFSPVHHALMVSLIALTETSKLYQTADAADLFPRLEIYDKDGLLAFRGRQILENLAIVSQLSVVGNRVTGLRSGPTIEKRLQTLGVGSAILTKSLKNGRVTALSLMMEQCDSCAVQQASLDSLEDKLLAQNQINTISVTVTLK